MLKEKVSFKKKPLHLDFFYSCPTESKSKSEAKGKSESKGRPESKARSAKERLFVGNPTDVGNQPLSLSLKDSKKEARPEEAGFATRTQEISFEDFLKLRPDKNIY
jgi:hypothetical protein